MSEVAPFFLSLNARLSKVYRTTTTRPAGRICAVTRLQYNRQTSIPDSTPRMHFCPAEQHTRKNPTAKPPHKLLLRLLPKHLELLRKMTRSTTEAANPSTKHSIQANREKQQTAVKQLNSTPEAKGMPHTTALALLRTPCSAKATARGTYPTTAAFPRTSHVKPQLRRKPTTVANRCTQSVNAVGSTTTL